MNPIEVPSNACLGRPECQVVAMGPPRGVSDDEVGTAQMLISPVGNDIPGFPARRQYAYYRPTPGELEQLNAGGFIEFCQYGNVVQPFSAGIWPAPTSAEDEHIESNDQARAPKEEQP